MTEKIKRTKKIRLILSLVFSLAIIGVVTSLLISLNSDDETSRNKLVFDEAHYTALLSDKIEESYMEFDEAVGSDDKDATLIGFDDAFISADAKTAANAFYKFLNIPEVTQDGRTVTKIDLTNMSNTSKSIVSFIRGVKIPKSVEYIETASFHGFGSLEYFETPFIGTERGSSGIGRLYPDDYTKESKPFVSMFTTPTSAVYVGDSVDSFGNITKNTTEGEYVQWYERNDADAQSYLMPGNLQKIIVYDDTMIGNHALFNLNMVRTIEISKDEEELAKSGLAFGDYAIAESETLLEVILPKEYVSFGIGVLSYNTELKSVSLPGKLTSIPTGTFDHCIKLESVLIPSSVVEIGDGAFKDCFLLTSITQFIESWDEVNEKETKEEETTEDKIVEFSLPLGLNTIGDEAFKNCYKLQKLTVPNSVTYIGDSAFNGCHELQTLSIPFVGAHRGDEHVTGICNEGENTYKFHNLFGYIFGITGDSKKTYVANQRYGDGTLSQNFYIPSSLKYVYITNDTKILDGAFQNLTSITHLQFNDEISSISESALNGCISLKQLSVPFAGSNASGGEHIGYIFGKTAYNGGVLTESYYIPTSLETVVISNQPIIYTGTFNNCTNIKEVEFKNPTQQMQHSVFYNNPMLTTLSVPFVGIQRGIFNPSGWWWRDEAWRNTLEWIFSGAYHDGTYQNNSLRWYDSYIKYIPSSLETVYVTDDTVISTYAFKNFVSLKNISITSSQLTYIDQACMVGCQNLEILNVPFIGKNANPTGLSGREYTIGWFFGQGSYGNSYLANQYAAYYIPNNLKAITISGSSAKIPDYAMAGMTSLKSFTANATIDTLGNYAFYNCKILEKVETPNARYKKVGNFAFYNCQNIYDIDSVIPLTVNNIGNYAFSGSSVGGSAHPLVLKRYTTLGNYAFSNCYEIEAIEFTADNVNIGEGVFQDCQYLTDVKLAGKVSKNLFKNCYKLEDIDFEDITVIPEGVLSGCKSLKTAYGDGKGFIQDELTEEIGAYAFYGCESLESFQVKFTTKKIGSYAFSKCTGLEYMTMPKETEIIDPHGWDDCDPNFFFYVYEAEEDWPTGWVENWNCYYPVYIIGQQNDSIFTYEYYHDQKGYFITGVEEGITLEGQVQLPSYHDGLRVLGVYGLTDSGVFSNNLTQQTKVTSYVIPKSYYFIYKGVFTTGKRVDLYFERTKAEVAAIKTDSTIPSTDSNLLNAYSKGWEVGTYEKELVSGGLVFYGSDWQYVNVTENSKVPHIKASSLEFTLDFGDVTTPIYTGKAIKPIAISSIKLPAIVVISPTLGVYDTTAIIDAKSFTDTKYQGSDYFEQDFTNMFNYTYVNNIAAGTATMNAALNSLRYEEYNAALSFGGQNEILITGTKAHKFTINKARVDLYLEASNDYNEDFDYMDYWFTTYLTHEYNQYQWTNSIWTNNVSGLENFPGTKFSGTIATRSANAGIYVHNSTWTEAPFANDDFVWTNPWTVKRNGVDITRNFEIYVFLTVEIKPMSVTLEWTGGSWNNETTKDYYQYRYNGSKQIEPQARALRYDTINDVTTNEVVSYCNVIARNKVAQVGQYPSDTLYDAFAYLTDNNNFKLVDETGQTIEDVTIVDGVSYLAYNMKYKIIKGLIRINISASYVIAPNENEWSFTFDEYTNEKYKTLPAGYSITGLGQDSIFHGKLYSLSDEVGIYSYTEDGAVTSGKYIKWVDTAGPDQNGYTVYKNFHIYRKIDDGNGNYTYLDELALDYYDVQIDNVSINLQYNDFDIEYYVSEISGANEQAVPHQDTINASNRHIVDITFAVDGKDYKLYAKALNNNTTGNLVINYFTENGQAVGLNALAFTKVGEYFIGVTVNDRHFNSYQANVNLKAIKSDISFTSTLNKQYDRHPHDLINDNFILKMGADQTLNVKYYNQYDVNHLTEIDAPINVGKYTVCINASETDYFNPIENRYVDFEITKRIIKIDLSGANNLYEEGTITGSKLYDGTAQTFTPINSDLISRGYVLGDEYLEGVLICGADQFVGKLSTAGYRPDVYDADSVYWLTSWGVFTAEGENNTSNYQVQIDNTFTILPLTFIIHENNVNEEFDYKLHRATIDVTPTDSNYKIYYSTISFDVTETDFSGYSTINFDFSNPGEYKVYYAVVADNYETAFGDLDVIIRAKTIVYHDPAHDVVDSVDTEMHYIADATGSYIAYVVEVSDPIFATVYYSLDNVTWTTTPYEMLECGYLDIYYKIEALYYDTVYSMKDNSPAPVRFIVSEDNLPELGSNYSAEGYSTIYDGNTHCPHIIVPSDFTGKVLYSLDREIWTETPIGYENAGTYDIYVRIKVNGYKSKEFKTTIKIEKLSFDGLKLKNYDDYFDNEYHTVEVEGLTQETIEVLDPDNPQNKIEKTIYTYKGVEVTIGYTSNPHVVSAGYGYQSELSYKDVGLYTIYVMVSAPNYNDLSLGAGTVNIKFRPTNLIDIEYNYTEIEYSKAPVDYDLLDIKTVHDGIRTHRVWAAKCNSGVLSCDFTEEVYAPQELGYYCFMVYFSQSKNCGAAVLGEDPYFVYFRIIAKQLTVEWVDEAEYDGLGHSPEPKVETGTGDDIQISFKCTDPSIEYPVEVGTYTFNIWMSTKNDNYVLDIDTITMSIKKRVLDINFVDSKEYDGEIYEKNDGWDSVLNLPLLSKHKFIASMKTDRFIKGTYYYTTLTNESYSNSVIVEWDIIQLDENFDPVLDGGNYVSVKDYYDYSLTATISITNPVIDLSFIEDTVVKYDGDDHSVDIRSQLPVHLDGALLFYRRDANEDFHSNPISYILAGEYPIQVKVRKAGYEDSIVDTKLIIEKTDLEIEIFDLDDPDSAEDDGYDIYDSTEKFTNYQILNLLPNTADNFVSYPKSTQGHIRYYNASEITLEELQAFYKNFDSSSTIYQNSLERVTNAGDYFCVVYYKDTSYQWNASFAIKRITVKPKDITVTYANITKHRPTYDGNKYAITLDGATVDTSALISGHNFLSEIKYHSIRTNSPNAGVYNPKTGFEFVEKTIFDAAGNDVSMNYHPVVNDNLDVEILRAYLTADDFIVTDNKKQYDGLVAAPNIVTPSDGEIHYEFSYYEEGTGNKLPCVPSNFQSDVGHYYVGCYIEQGTNYFASSEINPKTGTSLPTMYADCIVIPSETEVEWTNKKVTFNGKEQSAVASFKDVFGNTIFLDVFYYDEDNQEVSGFVASGVYEAYSKLDEHSKVYDYELFNKNYKLNNTTTTFTIEPILYDIVLGSSDNGYSVTSEYTGSAWSMAIDTTVIPDFPEGLTLKGLTGDVAYLTTTSAQPGSYTGNSMFNFNDIKIYKDNEDVSDSIGFNIIGTVTIFANQILFNTYNKTFVYSPDVRLFSQTGCLLITNPSYNDCQISYVVNGEPTLVEPTFTDVGSYEIEFTITDKTGQYTSVSGSVFLEIVPAESFLEFEDEIGKVYDGTPVSVSIDRNSGFNGTELDLQYEFVEVVSDGLGGTYEVSIGSDKPIDVGNYIVYVTCNESYLNANGLLNYTSLNVSKAFSITPREYKLTINDSITITAADEGKEWSSGSVDVNSQNELISGNVLTYEIQSTFNIVRTTYVAKKTIKYVEPTSAASQTQQLKFIASALNGKDYDFAMAWNIIDSNRFMSDGTTPLNISKNYYLTFDFTLYIHYKLIEGVTISGGTYPYDGNQHHGTIDFSLANVTEGMCIQGYALDASYFTNSGDVYCEIDNSNLRFIKPGTYPVYYQITATEYEPLVGSFEIIIEKVERQNFEITSLNKKIYDANPMFSKWAVGNNNYLPEFDYDFFKVGETTLSDNISFSDITIVYQLNGSSTSIDSTVGCIRAGNYLYTLTIPESNNYLETVYEGTFTIARRQILISDKAVLNEIVYTGNTITYNNFGSTSAYDIYYVDDSGNNTTLPNNYSISGIIYTSSTNAGIYNGKENTLNWFNGATVTVDNVDQSSNHTVSLEAASLTIAKAQMVYNDLTTAVPYNAEYHTIDIQMIMPLQYDSIYYWDTTTSSWTTDPTNFKFRDVGIYPVRVKLVTKNYEDEIIDTQVIIERAESDVKINVDLNKVYDGKEVVIPEDIYTSNTEAQDITMYTFIYHEWVFNSGSGNYEWAIMSTIEWDKANNGWKVDSVSAISRPVNVGKYLVQVIVPETTNYKANSASSEFEITGRYVDVTWENLKFTYDGTSKAPTPYLPLCEGDEVPLKVTITPKTTTADADHKNVGGYLAEAEIDTDLYSTGNYIINTMSSQTLFNIVKRDLVISLNTFTTYVTNSNYNFYLKTSTVDGYTATGLVNNSPIVHSIEGYLTIKNGNIGTYTSLGTDGFLWCNTFGETTQCVIRDESSINVTDNYNITYNLNAIISYSDINATVDPYTGVYDGKSHQITVTINNINASDYTVEYSTDNVNFSKTNPGFINANSNGYDVYVKIYRTTDITDAIYAKSKVTIYPKDAQLSLINPYIDLTKVYDGMPIVDPAVSCEDPDADIVYKYYMNNKLTLDDIVDVGTYVLVIEIENGSSNYSYLPIERTFKITKRPVTITVPKDTKIYNYEAWSKEIKKENVYNIVSTHTFSGILQSKTVNVGTYDEREDFDWSNGYRILDENNKDVTSNYDVSYDLNVKITKAPMAIQVTAEITTYTGAEFTLKEVKLVPAVVDGVTYPVPTSYKIYYSENPLNGYTLDPVYKSMVGKWLVYIKVEADNYETLIVKNAEDVGSYILIEGLPFGNSDDSDDPTPPGEGPNANDSNLSYTPEHTYNGKNYPTPEYITTESSGEQVVVYYKLQDYLDNKIEDEDNNIIDLSNCTPYDNVKDAGSYVFVLTIKTDGIHEEKKLHQSFVIKPANVTLVWEDITVSYNGNEQTPKAYYTEVEADGSDKVYVDITNVPKIAAGSYDVLATINDTNYTSENLKNTYVINKQVIEQPNFENLEVTYGDDLIIKDTNGYIYKIDADGKVTAVVDEEDNPISTITLPLPYVFILDTDLNADKDGSTHTLTVHFADKDNNDGKSNYIWSVNKDSEDLEIPYTIKPMEFPNDTYEIIVIYDDVHKYTGKEIEPEVELTVINSATKVTIAKLVLDTDFEVEYNNNINVTKAESLAEIMLTGINNYSFSIDKTFNIIAKDPDLLTIKSNENVKIQFITAVYDRENAVSTGVTIVEDDLVPVRNAENIEKENYYLSHIYQNTTVEIILKMFVNSSKKLRVYKTQQDFLAGNAIQEADYAKTYVGTGYVIALYEDEAATKLQDSIECIVFGDLTGDGIIEAADLNNVARIMRGKLDISTPINESDANVEKIADVYYFAGITTRGAVDGVTAVAANDIARMMRSSADSVDINLAYKFDPNAFVVPTPEETAEANESN